MSRMMKKDGRTTPSVAQNAPSTPPCDAPMKVAMLTASGPGVDSDTAMKLRNSASDFLPDEGDHAVAAAEGDGTDLQKGEE